MANYRNRELLDLAHYHNECMFQIPGSCIGYSMLGLEPAHSNELRHGKGTGIKSHDYMHVMACLNCHREYDSGTRFNKQEKQRLFIEGWERTISFYFTEGLIGLTEGNE